MRTWKHAAWLVGLSVTMAWSPPGVRAETLIDEEFSDPQALDDWRRFSPDSEVNVMRTAAGELRGERSASGGLVALARGFDEARQRVAVEFSLAVSAGRGRVFHVWSHEPEGRDASQLNLCVQGGRLQQFDGRTRSWETVPGSRIEASTDEQNPVWHRIRAVVDARSGGIDLFVSEPGKLELPAEPSATMAVYRGGLPLAGVGFVSGRRIAEGAWYLVDDLRVIAGAELPEPGPAPLLPEPFELWTGGELPDDPEEVPFAAGIEHRVIHRPEADGDKFLHGAAIFEHRGVLYANWANSPVHENGPHETLKGRRSTDGGETWSDIEVIGAGFEGDERHSHGVLFARGDEVWTIAARFGIGEQGRRFDGLRGEVFVLDARTDRWQSRGVVMRNCWPYDPPVPMADGNFIVGGQDKDGLPVVAVSQGDEFEKPWRSVLIPFPPRLAPSFAETTVWADGAEVMAVIRGGGGVAWVATSADNGLSWTTAQPSNLPMPRAKAFLGRLSTGQLFLVSNYRNRDTLVVSTGRPGDRHLSHMWRLRHGKSPAPRFEGRAKSPQWSYPYAHEHDGKLFVVYSIGKEECGLTVVPLASLRNP